MANERLRLKPGRERRDSLEQGGEDDGVVPHLAEDDGVEVIVLTGFEDLDKLLHLGGKGVEGDGGRGTLLKLGNES